jgi:DnaJ-domain-containing protein 1
MIGGIIVQVPKGTIAKVTTLDQEIDGELIQDPYDILGLSEKATDSEVESTYLRRAKSYHPDMIQAAGLPAEFGEIANTQLTRINEAYERIMGFRKDQGESAAEREPETD